jgi:hypothetical protein
MEGGIIFHFSAIIYHAVKISRYLLLPARTLTEGKKGK